MSRLLVPDRNFPEADLRPTTPPHFNAFRRMYE